MTIREKLSAIQQEMKAPKNLRNNFGNYNYRNAESILEAFKPYEEKYKVGLTISDKIECIGDRFYVKAHAVLFDTESDEFIDAEAYAREASVKKGMDDSQITGATSSYARKYCLNGLFLLDDTTDADGMNNKDLSPEEIKAKVATLMSDKMGAMKVSMWARKNKIDGATLTIDSLTDDQLKDIYNTCL